MCGTARIRYTVEAEPSPGLLPRLLQPFARRDLQPEMFSSDHWQGKIVVEIILTMPTAEAHLVEGNLRQVVGVLCVKREPDPLLAD